MRIEGSPIICFLVEMPVKSSMSSQWNDGMNNSIKGVNDVGL